MNLLHIDSSILGDGSATRSLTAAVVARIRTERPRITVTYRDLDREPLPHLGSGSVASADPGEAARAERTIAELEAANVLVLGAPMYNFSIPSTLKAWIDRVAIAGRSFRYREDGTPEGLLTGKRAVLVLAQGGIHEEGAPSEHHESYLKWTLGFLGISDIEVVRAQGLALGPEARAESLAKAHASLERVLAVAA